jgi:(S)-citramalyl-CoA lyase
MTDLITYPIRSWLFTPATRADRFAKAADAGADVAILDLEDAVAPCDKDAARINAFEYLLANKSGAERRALRINGLDTKAGISDVKGLLETGATPDYLILPKTESTGHLQILDRLLKAANRTTKLVGIVESARGLSAIESIAEATPRLAGLMLGAADMAADLGAETAWEPLVFARGRLIAACALAGITAIDSPFFDVRDADGLSREVARAVALGFQSKAAIHPAQVGAINAALTPDKDAIEKARAILAANVGGVGLFNGQMIDEAVARKARRTLAAAGLSS